MFLLHNAFCQDSNKQGYACTASYLGIRDKGCIYKDSAEHFGELVLEDCDADCKIISFVTTLTINGVSISKCGNTTYSFDIAHIADRGTNVVISSIKYSAPGTCIRRIPHSLTISIK